MASSPNFHHYPRVERTSNSATPSAPPLPETDTHHTEPVTGYPPVMGYPPNRHPHTLSPPPLLLPSHLQRPYISRRWVMEALIVIIVVAAIISAVVHTLYQPRTPVVTVVGMSVSNFTISSATTLIANWEVNVTVENPSMKMKATFGRVPTYIYYQNNLLSQSEADPLELGAKRKGRLNVSNTAEGKEQWLEDYVIQEMQMDWKNRKMSFNIEMGMSVVYRHSMWRVIHQSFRVLCSIIRVGFGQSGNNGSMLDGGRECQVS